jgi:hypothetical protein
MKPEDVSERWIWQLAMALDHPSVYMGGPSNRNRRLARDVLADIIPLIIAEEREACAKEADYYAKNSIVARNIATSIRARGIENTTREERI